MTLETFWSIVFLPLITAFLLTAIITPFVIRAMNRYKILDDPKLHKHPGILHTHAIPRGGGIALYFGSFLTALIFLPKSPIVIAVFFAAFLALIVGVIDDKLNAESKDVSPYLRFIVNILCGVIVVGSGVSMNFITHPFGGILHFDRIFLNLFDGLYIIRLSDVLAILWIVWVMNMLNWSKGVDGQMPGIVAISALVIGILSLRFTQLDNAATLDATLSFIIAGTALGFLVYNFHPAKIFPGYGATSLYLLLAVVSILSSAKLATAILVMGVPTIDAIFTIWRRILSGKSPFWHDNKHLHHLLLKIGFSKRQVALFYWVISAILGLLSLVLQSQSKVFALIMLAVTVIGALVFLHQTTRDRHETHTS
jgi:UDP-GlcNAc:undecaprenyl-phosphate/decaprenyl-phosphate GlcNAc-1-phosphate transferase